MMIYYKVFADGVEYDIILAVSVADAVARATAIYGDAVWTARAY